MQGVVDVLSVHRGGHGIGRSPGEEDRLRLVIHPRSRACPLGYESAAQTSVTVPEYDTMSKALVFVS